MDFFWSYLAKSMSISYYEAKVDVGMKEVSLKDAQIAFQKTITWIIK
jgi:hypothetical protein